MLAFYGKKWIKKGLWLAIYVSVAVVWYHAIEFKASRQVQNVEIQLITENGEKALIREEDILRYVNKILNKDLEVQTIEELEVKRIEEALNRSRFIDRAEVFVNTKGIVHIHCYMKTPIARFDRGDQKGFYMARDGDIIPLSERWSARVPLVNGKLGDLTADFLQDESSRYRQVYELALRIDQDPFLKALIEQIYVESNGKVIMVPKLGRQKIRMGEMASIDHKLDKLKAFYKTGMPSTGWNRFEYLNLEWKDQVVGEY